MDAYIQQEMLTVALKNVLLGCTIVRDSKSANVYIFWHVMETNQSVTICKKFGDSLEDIVGRF